MTDKITIVGVMNQIHEREAHTTKKDKKTTKQKIVIKEASGALNEITMYGFVDLVIYKNKKVEIKGLTVTDSGFCMGNSYGTTIDDRFEDNIPYAVGEENYEPEDIPDNITPSAVEGIEFRVLVRRSANFQNVEYEASGFSSIADAENYYYIMNKLAEKQLGEMKIDT